MKFSFSRFRHHVNPFDYPTRLRPTRRNPRLEP